MTVKKKFQETKRFYSIFYYLYYELIYIVLNKKFIVYAIDFYYLKKDYHLYFCEKVTKLIY